MATQQPPPAPAMTLTVAGFADGADVPVKFSQAAPGVATGEGLSPAISWANVPAGTQSFFLNMRDMDVARNKTTDDQAHWVVWNIPATATGLPEGVPKGLKRSASRLTAAYDPAFALIRLPPPAARAALAAFPSSFN